MNSKAKGKRGELKWAKFCREHGYEVRRTAQYCGNTGDASDCVGLPRIHIEVKRTERLNLYDAMAQATHDSMGKNIPIVAHRRNRSEWLVIQRAVDWFDMYRTWEAGNGNSPQD